MMVWWARLITNTFFRQIDVLGADSVPAAGAVIFAGNHPNALMDGWLLAARCTRAPLRFLVHAKLWSYPVLGWLLDRAGAVPVYPRQEHGVDTDNSAAFRQLYAVVARGECVGIFPEGISHVESQLAKLKTGTARVALESASRNNGVVHIVPCGLNYLHRHRFRSQVLLEFGAAIEVGAAWTQRYRQDAQAAVVALTDEIAAALASVTVNAPDWNTLRFAQISRRLYKPTTARLSPAQYVELNRRFLTGYLQSRDDPELQAFRAAAEDYQARLDLLGVKDYQLRKPLPLNRAARLILGRGVLMILLLPLAIPAALVHLPVGWAAAAVGSRFSYEQDDEATLKVFATLALLPLLYLAVVVLAAVTAGPYWAVLVAAMLAISTVASMRVLEAETSLLVSTVSLLRLARLESDIEELRTIRKDLVVRVRALVDRNAPPGLQRLFEHHDFQN